MGKTSKRSGRVEFLFNFTPQIDAHILDLSPKRSGAFAVYGLAEDGNRERVQYLDFTVNPQRRLLQHWMSPRLWLSRRAADRITSSTLQPLCHWIRALYEQKQRLPVMAIYEWLPSLSQAEAAAFAHRNSTTHLLRSPGSTEHGDGREMNRGGSTTGVVDQLSAHG